MNLFPTMCTGFERNGEAFAEHTQAGIDRILNVSSNARSNPGTVQASLQQKGSPTDDAGTAGVVSSETTMGDNGFASFSRDVKAIEANMLNTQRLLREATIELSVRQQLIEQYRSDKYAHQRLIGKLLELLNNDDLDTARNLVRDEFDAIHGPA